MTKPFALILAASLALTACTGVESQRAAEERCAAEASLADGIGGNIRAGVGTGGARGGLSLTITDNIFAPKDEITVYENCVFKRTGQSPSRSLAMVR